MVNERFMVNVIKDTVKEPVAKTKVAKSDIDDSQFWADYNSIPGKVSTLMYFHEQITSKEDTDEIRGMYSIAYDLFGVIQDMKYSISKSAKKSAIKKYSLIDSWMEKVETIRDLYKVFESMDSNVYSERESKLFHIIDDSLEEYVEVLTELTSKVAYSKSAKKSRAEKANMSTRDRLEMLGNELAREADERYGYKSFVDTSAIAEGMDGLELNVYVDYNDSDRNSKMVTITVSDSGGAWYELFDEDFHLVESTDNVLDIIPKLGFSKSRARKH